MRITRKHVAEKLGIAESTVSRAISDHRSISRSTIARVKKAAKELGYVPSHLGRSYFQSKSYRLGIVVPFRKVHGTVHSLSNEHILLLLYGAIYSSSREKYSINVFTDDGLAVTDLENLVKSRTVDGLIFLGVRTTDRRFAYLFSRQIPFLLIHHYVRDRPYYYIDTDSEIGLRQLFDHFANSHITRIGLLNGGNLFVNSIDRRNTIIKLIAEYGFRLLSSYEGNFSQQSGYEAAGYFARRKLPDAIICTNDNMAIGLVKGLQTRNVAIPGDVRVSGFDDFELSSFIAPALTTIHNPFYEIGMRAGTLLISLIQNEKIASESLPSSLVLRESA